MHISLCCQIPFRLGMLVCLFEFLRLLFSALDLSLVMKRNLEGDDLCRASIVMNFERGHIAKRYRCSEVRASGHQKEL